MSGFNTSEDINGATDQEVVETPAPEEETPKEVVPAEEDPDEEAA